MLRASEEADFEARKIYLQDEFDRVKAQRSTLLRPSLVEKIFRFRSSLRFKKLSKLDSELRDLAQRYAAVEKERKKEIEKRQLKLRHIEADLNGDAKGPEGAMSDLALQTRAIQKGTLHRRVEYDLSTFFNLTPTDTMGEASRYLNVFSPRVRTKVPLIDDRDPTLVYFAAPLSDHDVLIQSGARKDASGALSIGSTHPALKRPDIASKLAFAYRERFVPLRTHMIPQTSWGSSLANLASNWKEIKQPFLDRTANACVCCGAVPRQRADCHEIWNYRMPVTNGRASGSSSPVGVQKLLSLVGLCSDCHEMFHLGLANVRGRSEIVAKRLFAVNEWSAREGDLALKMLWEAWSRRNTVNWVLDLSGIAFDRIDVSKMWSGDQKRLSSAKYPESWTSIFGVVARYPDGNLMPARPVEVAERMYPVEKTANFEDMS